MAPPRSSSVTATQAAPPWRPTPADVEAARGRSIADLIAPGLRVLFSGINPGLWSGATGFHFARPGNRFWRVLYLAGFTDRVLAPSEGAELLAVGLGITNVVQRTTASESELSRDEFRAGAERLRDLVAQYRPTWLAIVGIGAYRSAFDDPKATIGRQALRLGDTGLWVLPNPSGLNASYQLPALVEAFAELRATADNGRA
jgi:TDG/mug DNA glycosylase family protein